MVEKVLRTQWGTPQWLFNRLHAQFHFTLDVAALPWNAKLPRFLGPSTGSLSALDQIAPEKDGLRLENWIGERVWCNPPYSKPGAWLEVAARACSLGDFSVLLVPNNWDTTWFDIATQGRLEVFDGRIPHDPPPGVQDSSPRGAQMLVVFDPSTFSFRPRATPSVFRRSAETGFYLEDRPWTAS